MKIETLSHWKFPLSDVAWQWWIAHLHLWQSPNYKWLWLFSSNVKATGTGFKYKHGPPTVLHSHFLDNTDGEYIAFLQCLNMHARRWRMHTRRWCMHALDTRHNKVYWPDNPETFSGYSNKLSIISTILGLRWKKKSSKFRFMINLNAMFLL